jgi:MFS family permease
MNKKSAVRFVILLGVVSLFADVTYEGSRSITGPYLALLGANATVVGIVAGFGELLGYGLRLVSGRLSERTGRFWFIAIFGYLVQMLAVPLLALAGNWQFAAALIVLERVGKATRKPPMNVVLSHATKEMGHGWGFGVHEALDQLGALTGPLLVSAVLAARGSYQLAFAVLLVPAALTLALVVMARLTYPQTGDMEISPPRIGAQGLPRTYWVYLAGAALVGAGVTDFSIMAFHFQRTSVVSAAWIPIFYSISMGVSGPGALLFGRLFDRVGIKVLAPLTLVSALAAPLVFLGGFKVALLGTALWGFGMGVHESIIPAAVATIVPVDKRASAYGMFTAGFGLCWFLGSVLTGILYDVSLPAVIFFSVAAQLLAIPFFLRAARE